MDTRQQDSRKGAMAAIDFISSIILIVFSLGIALWSLKMPRPVGWSSAPGLVPLFLSISTFFMGLGLFISSIRNRGFSQFITKCKGSSLSKSISNTKAKRSLWIILLTIFYIFVLLGRIPFEIASFIYLACTLYIFWRRGGWLKIILISILLPFITTALFRVLFVVFMPGESIFGWLLSYFK